MGPIRSEFLRLRGESGDEWSAAAAVGEVTRRVVVHCAPGTSDKGDASVVAVHPAGTLGASANVEAAHADESWFVVVTA